MPKNAFVHLEFALMNRATHQSVSSTEQGVFLIHQGVLKKHLDVLPQTPRHFDANALRFQKLMLEDQSLSFGMANDGCYRKRSLIMLDDEASSFYVPTIGTPTH